LAEIDTQKLQMSDTLRIFEERVGAKNYELSNHLGNVLATISDKTIFNTDHYNGIVYSAQLYYPFGWEIPTLSYSAKKYRFGFNGKEDDREWHAQDYGFRLYTPREGRFIGVDPITAQYPWYTPYQFAGNKPIAAVDLDGLEEYDKYYWRDAGASGPGSNPALDKATDETIGDILWFPEVIVLGTVKTAQTVGTYSSFVLSAFGNGFVYGIGGTKDAEPFQFYDFYDFKWKGWGTNEGRASHDRMLGDGTGEVWTSVGGGIVSKGLTQSFKLLRKATAKSKGLGSATPTPINPHTNVNGENLGRINCVGCALATDARLKGRDAVALSDRYAEPPFGTRDFTELLGNPVTYGRTGMFQMEQKLLELGNGATAIVGARRAKGQMGHAFNMYNDNGVVRIIDSQNSNEYTRQTSGTFLRGMGMNEDGNYYDFYNTTGK
jgi:RHS repeat-associated protein